MRRMNILTLICFLVLAGSVVSAQREAPAGASDKGPADRSIKDRSLELERIKRNANKPDAKNQQAAAVKFEEIKEDFESLQRRQDEILKIYRMSKQIELEKIAQNADLMNKSATRLGSNLFPAPEDKKGKKKSKDSKEAESAADDPVPQDLKSIIVEQDNTLASFVSNPIFANPQVAKVEDHTRAHSDLKKLIKLTASLKIEAEKQPN